MAARLVISAIGQQKSILLSSVISIPQRNIKVQCVSLVDSGCTGEAFLDENLVIKTQEPPADLLERVSLAVARCPKNALKILS